MTQIASNLVPTKLASVERINETDYLEVFTFKPQRPIPFKPGQYVNLVMEKPGLIDLVKNVQDVEGKKGEPAYDDEIKRIEKQKALIERNGYVQRQYSIFSPPNELDSDGKIVTYNDGNIKLYIIRVDRDGIGKNGRGLVTTELFKREEEREDINFYFNEKAKGLFLLPEHSGNANDTRDRVIVATGTGIAPYLSMLEDPTTIKEGINYVLFHGVSTQTDHAFKERISKLVLTMNLIYVPVASRGTEIVVPQRYTEQFFMNEGRTRNPGERVKEEEIMEAIAKGKIHDTPLEGILGHELSPENALVMACGNPGMRHSLEIITTELGFGRKDFLKEDFW